MAKAGRRTAQDADDVRARLIDATVRVLARDGFAHASARSIAAEAGGANALIFYHFGSMDGLLSATVDALAERGIAFVLQLGPAAARRSQNTSHEQRATRARPTY